LIRRFNLNNDLDDEYGLGDPPNIFDIDAFDESTLSEIIEQVYESLELLENIMYSMYFSHRDKEKQLLDTINNYEVENGKYREEIKRLYQELAYISKKKEE